MRTVRHKTRCPPLAVVYINYTRVSHLLVAIHPPFLTCFISMCCFSRPPKPPPRPQRPPPRQPSPEQPPSAQPPLRHPSEQPPLRQHPSKQPPLLRHPSAQPPLRQHPSERSPPLQPLTRKTSPRPFDRTGFCDRMHDFGRAYRFQANELIKICRSFSAASDQSIDQDTELSR